MLGQYSQKQISEEEESSREKWETVVVECFPLFWERLGKKCRCWPGSQQVAECMVWRGWEECVSDFHPFLDERWRFRTGDSSIFSGWHKQRWALCPRAERYVTEGLDTAGESMWFCQRLNGSLVSVPGSFSFQLSFVPFSCWPFLIQSVAIKLTSALKPEFASLWVPIATVLFEINSRSTFSRDASGERHL